MSQLGDKLGIELPVIQAPMAGVQGARLAAAVTQAGGLGSIPCAMLSVDEIRQAVADVEAETDGPYNLNFFCHQEPKLDARIQHFVDELAPYFAEFGIDVPDKATRPARQPFNEELAALVEGLKPRVVSFHFGLPADQLLKRVVQTGATIFSSATTVDEARWLESRGVDAVIVQGIEAGGHRGHFLSDDLSIQQGTADLLAATLEAVDCPVIAAGGISTPASVSRMLGLGAECVQIGTAYLLCPEADTSEMHRAALLDSASETALTNLFTGRPARGLVNRLMKELGPISESVPEFPLASTFVTALRRVAERNGSGDFSPLWAGTLFADCQIMSAKEITHQMAGVDPG